MHPTDHRNGTPTHADTPNGEKKPAPGRDANGRFARGNLGGPGNPFARQIAGFRRALCNAVTEQDIAELAQLLLAKAKAGDLLAMKLLFQYTLGRPAEAADPDSLDAQEMQLFQQNNAESDTMTDLVRGTPADFAVEVLRVLLPTRSKQLAGTMGQMLKAQSEPAATTPPEPTAPPPAPRAKEPPANGHAPAPVDPSSRLLEPRTKSPAPTGERPMRNATNGHSPTDGKRRKRAARRKTGSPALDRFRASPPAKSRAAADRPSA